MVFTQFYGIIQFLSLKETQFLQTSFILSRYESVALEIITIAAFLFVFYRISIKKQPKLGYLMGIYRYFVLKILLRYYIWQVYENEKPYGQIGIIFFFSFLISNFYLFSVLELEYYHEMIIEKKYQPVGFYFLIYDFTFSVFEFEDERQYKLWLSLAMILISFYSYQIFEKYQMNNNQFMFLQTAALISIIQAIFIMASFLFNLKSSTFFLIFLVTIVYSVYKVNQKQKIDILESISFISQKSIKIENFIDNCQQIISKIKQIQNSCDKCFQKNQIVTFVQKHYEKCQQKQCQLLQNNIRKIISEEKSIEKALKYFKQELLKKFKRILFQKASEQNDRNESRIHLIILKLYFLLKANKIQIIKQLSIVKMKKSRFVSKYKIYKFQTIINSLQDQDQTSKLEAFNNGFDSVKSLIISNISDFMNFWYYADKQEINFSEITQKCIQICQGKQKIKSIIQDLQRRDDFLSYKSTILYQQFLLKIYQDDSCFQYDSYLNILSSKLAHDISFKSNTSDCSMIMISLSQNTLGRIIQVNTQASVLFGFTKQEFMFSRINMIIPDVYGEFHDRLLHKFIDNKKRTYNKDQRIVVAKNKQGRLFRVLLRLKKMSDQSKIIGNIKQYRKDSADILCIVGKNGEIIEFSSAFQYFFLKPDNKKMFWRKPKTAADIKINIDFQYFQNFSEPQNATTFSTEFQAKIEFEIQPITLLDVTNGYLLIGKRQVQDYKEQTRKLTSKLYQNVRLKEIRCHRNTFDIKQTTFQIGKSLLEINDIKPCTVLTIPFIKIDSINQILKFDNGREKNYDKNIRPLRYHNNKLMPVEDQYSFKTDSQVEQENNFKHQQQNYKMLDSKKEVSNFITKFKFLFALLLLLFCCLSIDQFIKNSEQIEQSNIQLEQSHSQYTAMTAFSKYISFKDMSKLSQNLSLFNISESIKQLHDIVDDLKVSQQIKQNLIKVLYLDQQYNKIDQIFNSALFHKNKYFKKVLQLHFYHYYLMISIIVLLILVSVFTIKVFKRELAMVFNLFIYLDEKHFKKIFQQCQKFVQANYQKQEALQLNFSDNFDHIQQDEGQSNLRKKKKIYNIQRNTDIFYFIKIMIPFLILIILVALSFGFTLSMTKNYKKQNQLFNSIQSIVPLSSQLIARTILSEIGQHNNLQISIFQSFLYDTQSTLQQFKFEDINQMFTQQIKRFLGGNLCLQLGLDNTTNCPSFFQKIQEQGISNSLNFIFSTCLEIKNNSSNLQNISNLTTDQISIINVLSQLVQLQFSIINPVMKNYVKHVQNQKQSIKNDFIIKSNIVDISIILLAMISFIYISLYPIKQMQRQIGNIKTLIDFVSILKKKKKKSPKKLLQ